LPATIAAVGCRFLTIALIVAFAAACTQATGSSPSPTPSTRPTTSTPATTSTSPEPTQTGPLTTGPNVRPGEKPPMFPRAANRHSRFGAQVFALYYFKAFDWGYATNDPSLVQRISSTRCGACRSYVTGLQSVVQHGNVLLGGRISLRPRSSISPNHYRIEADYVVDVRLDEAPVLVATPSATRTAAPALVGDHSLVFVSWSGGRWRVVEVTDR
jgi:hypothetical protein